MTTFNYLTRGEQFLDEDWICPRHKGDLMFPTRLYRFDNGLIIGIYSNLIYNDNFLDNCFFEIKSYSVNRILNKLVPNYFLTNDFDGKEHICPRIECDDCKISIYDMIY